MEKEGKNKENGEVISGRFSDDHRHILESAYEIDPLPRR
jgi:hypothetical protein